MYCTIKVFDRKILCGRQLLARGLPMRFAACSMTGLMTSPNTPELKLHHLRLFLSVARELNFTHAAQSMNMAQPAVSRAIRQLEAAVGTPLFKRNTRSVELTPAGSKFRQEVQLILRQLDHALESARDLGSSEAGRIRVGFMDFALKGVLPGLVREYRTRHPGYSVVMHGTHTQRALQELHDHEIDVGFVIGPTVEPGIETLLVQRDPMVVVTPDTHPLGSKSTVHLSDLEAEPLVMGSRESWPRYIEYIEGVFSEAGIRPNVVQETDTTESIFALIAAGIGSTIHVDCASTYYPKGVSVRPLSGITSGLQTELAWRADEETRPVLRFVDLARERASDSGF